MKRMRPVLLRSAKLWWVLVWALTLMVPTAAARAALPEGSNRPPATAPPAPAGAGDRMGLDAPVLVVDRFRDGAGTRLLRSRRPGLPGPGQPIDLDSPLFLRTVQGPDGSRRFCYDLDLRAAEPGRFYVFYDTLMQYVITQLPVVDRVPGDPNYTDLWEIWKVTIPNGMPTDNRIRDLETLRRLLADPSSGYTAEKTGHLLNAPIVPEGSHASMKADNRSGPAALLYAWHRGKRAPYLYFEQNLVSDALAPVSEMTLAGHTDPADLPGDGTLPAEAPAAVSGSVQGVPRDGASSVRRTAPDGAGSQVAATPQETVSPTDPPSGSRKVVPGSSSAGRPTVRTLPGQDGYSPLMRLVDAGGRLLYPTPLNCPVVGGT